MNFSFSGCGFLGVYHLGVVSCLKTRAPHLLPHIQSVGGASAGALAAVFLLSPRADVDAALERVLETSERLRSHYLGPFDPRFDILGELELSLRRLLPDDVHISTSGKLRVSLTVVKGRRRLENLIVRDFESRDDLIEVIFSSFVCQLATVHVVGGVWSGGCTYKEFLRETNTKCLKRITDGCFRNPSFLWRISGM